MEGDVQLRSTPVRGEEAWRGLCEKVKRGTTPLRGTRREGKGKRTKRDLDGV